MAEVPEKEDLRSLAKEGQLRLIALPTEMKDGCCMVQTFWDMADKVKELDIKQDDVWVITFPKSGTTWMQEAVWLLTHNLDYEGSKALLKYRSPALETCWASVCLNRTNPPLSDFEKNAALCGGRRVLKTHLHWKLLPSKLQDPNTSAKIIYVSRNPKDACVSYFYFFRFIEYFRTTGITLDLFAEQYMGNMVMGPYWTHVKGYWEQRNRPNILWVRYEEMKKDLRKVLEKVSTFLDVPVPTGEQMDKLLNHLSFESMRKNPALNREVGPEKFRDEGSPEDGHFIRKGIVGDWKEKLPAELAEKMDKWIAENTKDIDWPMEDSL